jgi:hypothetical protein
MLMNLHAAAQHRVCALPLIGTGLSTYDTVLSLANCPGIGSPSPRPPSRGSHPCDFSNRLSSPFAQEEELDCACSAMAAAFASATGLFSPCLPFCPPQVSQLSLHHEG